MKSSNVSMEPPAAAPGGSGIRPNNNNNDQGARTSSARDRFIPMRQYTDVERANYLIRTAVADAEIDEDIMWTTNAGVNKGDAGQFVNKAKKRYHAQNYCNLLSSIFLAELSEQRILNFFPRKNVADRHTFNKQVPKTVLWPVKGRSVPVIGPPTIVLDLPEFNKDRYSHVIDWSSTGCIAYIYNREVRMYYPNIESSHKSTATFRRINNCVKWNETGTQFAVSLMFNKIGIWDIAANKLAYEEYCCGMLKSCTVNCIEWIHDRYLLIGCSRGRITLCRSNLQSIHISHGHLASIVRLAVSCNRHFLASSARNGSVRIWILPNLQPQFEIAYDRLIRLMAWHPWKESHLVIAHNVRPDLITLWNVQTQKKVPLNGDEATSLSTTSTTNDGATNCYKLIDSLTFNPISAELVIGNRIAKEINGELKITYTVTVLLNHKTVVEELCLHTGPILYLLWNNNGKILASGSADENLCVWDFFGSENKQKELKTSEEKSSGKSKFQGGGMLTSNQFCIR